MISCCKDCKERYPACWGTCEQYREQKHEHDEQRDKQQREKKHHNSANQIQFHGITKIKKRRNER